jgi:hypothetical protein
VIGHKTLAQQTKGLEVRDRAPAVQVQYLFDFGFIFRQMDYERHFV